MPYAWGAGTHLAALGGKDFSQGLPARAWQSGSMMLIDVSAHTTFQLAGISDGLIESIVPLSTTVH